MRGGGGGGSNWRTAVAVSAASGCAINAAEGGRSVGGGATVVATADGTVAEVAGSGGMNGATGGGDGAAAVLPVPVAAAMARGRAAAGGKGTPVESAAAAGNAFVTAMPPSASSGRRHRVGVTGQCRGEGRWQRRRAGLRGERGGRRKCTEVHNEACRRGIATAGIITATIATTAREALRRGGGLRFGGTANRSG